MAGRSFRAALILTALTIAACGSVGEGESSAFSTRDLTRSVRHAAQKAIGESTIRSVRCPDRNTCRLNIVARDGRTLKLRLRLRYTKPRCWQVEAIDVINFANPQRRIYLLPRALRELSGCV